MNFNTILEWSLGIFLGIILIVLISLYIRGAFRDRVEYKVKYPPSPGEPRFLISLASLSNSLLSSGMVTDIWNQPNEIQRVRLEAIQKAQSFIHFETYFMTPGQRANDFAAAVSERADVGVQVQILVDQYGTKNLPKKYWNRLKMAGVEVLFFNKFDWKAPANYAGRTHRKLLLIDGKVAYVGGAGISDHWDGQAGIGEKEPWLDCEFRLEGEIVAVLEGVFVQHWTYAGGVSNLGTDIFKLDPADKPSMLVTAGFNPTYRFSAIRTMFLANLLAARQRIWLASPYFLPDKNSQELLMTAKERGLDVKVLTTSICCDKRFVYYASREDYRDLLKAGVEIYEYQPSMIHAKLLLIDDRWLTTGSANFDPRSFFHNDELDFSTGEPNVITHVSQIFADNLQKSRQIRLEDWQKRPLWQKLLGRLVKFVQWQL